MKFKEFLGEDVEFLTESLNSPQEYYLTDDTKMPESLYASFSIDGTPYIMALVQTNAAGIYIMEVGMPKGSTTSWWKFKKANHIAPVLSTAVSFAAASTAFLQGKIKGVAVRFRAGHVDARGKAGRLIKAIIKRSYVKSFVFVPSEMPEQKSKTFFHYQFIAKKGVSPSTLFAGKMFKGYDLPSEGSLISTVIPQEALGGIKEKKKLKSTCSTKASTEYKFSHLGSSDLNIDAFDQEFIDKIYDASEVKVEVTSASKSSEPVEVDLSKIYGTYQEKIKDKIKNFSSIKSEINDKPSDAHVIALFFNLSCFTSMVGKVKQFGFDENKVKLSDLNYVMKQAPAKEKEVLLKCGLFNSNFDFVSNDAKELFFNSLAMMDEIHKSSTNWSNYVETVNDYYGGKEIALFLNSKTSKNTASGKDTSSAPISLMNGEPVVSVASQYSSDKKFKVSKASVDAKTLQGSLMEDTDESKFGFDGEQWVLPGWNPKSAKSKFEGKPPSGLGWYDSIKSLSSSAYDALETYTGSGYTGMNVTMRGAAEMALFGEITGSEDAKWYMEDINSLIGGGDSYRVKKINTLSKVFDEIDPIQESFWVFRGLYPNDHVKKIMEVGGYYFDPGFMSTSLRTDLGFGGYEGIKMRIFIPKGSKVIPALGNSANAPEDEIILPPGSAIKIIERFDPINEDGSAKTGPTAVTGVLVGSAWKDMMSKIKSQKNEDFSVDKNYNGV